MSEKVEEHTISRPLGHRLLPPTPPHADTENHIALLGLVAQAAGLVRAGRA